MSHAEGRAALLHEGLVALGSETPPTNFRVCPRCTLHCNLEATSCPACGGALRPRTRSRGRHRPQGGSGDGLPGVILRAALAGMAGLALGRASHHQGVQRLLVTALAVAAVPLASSALGSLLGLGRRQGQPRGFAATGPARTFADREARRRQLRRAAAGAFDQAAAEGAISADERGLMAAILAPAGSRTERVRAISAVVEALQQMEAAGTSSRATRLVGALAGYELSALVDEMDYEELYAAFGGHPPPKGLPQDVIESLPCLALTPAALPGLHSPTCAVCLEAFAAGDAARLLPGCPHCFHAACVDPWLASKALCPVCRTPVQPPAPGKATSDTASTAAGAP